MPEYYNAVSDNSEFCNRNLNFATIALLPQITFEATLPKKWYHRVKEVFTFPVLYILPAKVLNALKTISMF